jgi:hypothetical protein
MGDDREVGVGRVEQAEQLAELGLVASDGEAPGGEEVLDRGRACDDLVESAALDAHGGVGFGQGATAVGEDAVLEGDGVLLGRVGEPPVQGDAAVARARSVDLDREGVEQLLVGEVDDEVGRENRRGPAAAVAQLVRSHEEEVAPGPVLGAEGELFECPRLELLGPRVVGVGEH